MKQLIETETFELLLSDNSKTATDNLIKEIIRLGETEANLASLYRTLHYTRFHLESMTETSGIPTEMGKKCIGAALCHLHRAGISENANAGTSSCFARQTRQETLLDRQGNRFS